MSYIAKAWQEYQNLGNPQLYPVHFQSKNLKADVFMRFDSRDNSVYLNFQGSVQWQDWLLDFLFLKKTIFRTTIHGTCKAHRGAWISWKSIESKVIGQINTWISSFGSVNRFYIQGHSLGGAVALCSLFSLSRAYLANFQVVTFGGYRVFNQSTVSYLRESKMPNVTRVIYGNELPRFYPPRLFGYRHFDSIAFHIGPTDHKWPSIKDHTALFSIFGSDLDKLFSEGKWEILP